jgi:hypothetical protein
MSHRAEGKFKIKFKFKTKEKKKRRERGKEREREREREKEEHIPSNESQISLIGSTDPDTWAPSHAT